MSKSALFTVSTITIIAALTNACVFDTVSDNNGESERSSAADPGTTATDQPGDAPDRGGAPTSADLAGRRARVLWEAARAMVGPTKASAYAWPTPAAGTNKTLATYPYLAEDAGAWQAAFKVYSVGKLIGDDATCTANWDYECPLKFGVSAGLMAYTCQGPCASASATHGGQCKVFNNLVLYRSGVYHDNSWSFRKLPTDSVIGGNKTLFPLAVKGKLASGDVLRQPNGHSVIVVRVIDGNSCLVFDSNWFLPYDSEIVGSHVMTFSGTGKYDNLARYQVMNCVYDGSC